MDCDLLIIFIIGMFILGMCIINRITYGEWLYGAITKFRIRGFINFLYVLFIDFIGGLKWI
jgi:hypothetical protein